jgi:hypothetical protein
MGRTSVKWHSWTVAYCDPLAYSGHGVLTFYSKIADSLSLQIAKILRKIIHLPPVHNGESVTPLHNDMILVQ